MISRHKWKPTRSMKANWQLSSICRWNRKKSKWTRLFSSSTMQLGGNVKYSWWTCPASAALSPDSSEEAAEATTDSASTPRTSSSAPAPGLRAPCTSPTPASTSSELSLVFATICAWKVETWITEYHWRDRVTSLPWFFPAKDFLSSRSLIRPQVEVGTPL